MFEGAREIFAGALEVFARSLTQKRQDPSDSRAGWYGRTLAGVYITPDNCVTLPAVWRGISFISQTTASMPWHVMQDGPKGAAIAKTNPVEQLLYKRPAKNWSSFQFRETLLHWALRWGNGYAEIEPDQLRRPYAMWPIHPSRVDVCRADAAGQDAYGEVISDGDLYYEVSGSAGEKISLSTQRMFHLRGFGEDEVGVNVIAYAAESMGWAKAIQMFGASFFGNGANVGQVLINKKPLKPDGLARQKRELEAMYKGPRNANKTAVFDSDAELKQIGLDAEKSQLNESNRAQVLDICRWLGVPPHKVMDLTDAHFNNLEHQNTEVVVDCIAPWVKRFEDEADYKLFGTNRQNFYTKINMNALMRGDVKTRSEFYKTMVYVGAYSPNRVLELEGENTIGPAGDIHVMQGQNVTLERIAAGDTPPPASQPPAEGTTASVHRLPARAGG